MNRGRLVGIVLIAAGLVLAVLVGLWLAVGATNGLEANALFSRAALIFIPLALLVGLGIYQIAQSYRHIDEDESDMERQRHMVDLLKSGQPMAFTELAAALNVGAGDVRALLNQLIRLQVFSGSINWQMGVVQMIDPAVLDHLTHCANCGEALPPDDLICPHCGTQYFSSTIQ